MGAEEDNAALLAEIAALRAQLAQQKETQSERKARMIRERTRKSRALAKERAEEAQAAAGPEASAAAGLLDLTNIETPPRERVRKKKSPTAVTPCRGGTSSHAIRRGADVLEQRFRNPEVPAERMVECEVAQMSKYFSR
jgi:hypothetical protein